MSDISEDDSVEEIIAVRQIPRSRVQLNNLLPNNVNEYNSYLSGSRSPASGSSTPPRPRKIVPAFETEVSKPGLLHRSISGCSTQSFPPIISLNVGGTVFMTRLSTLLRYSDSMLAAMFSGRHQIDQDSNGHYFLDSNGTTFSYILDFLRHGALPPNNVCALVYRDANYYGLHELAQKLSLKPEVVTEVVKEAHRVQFPDYSEFKADVIRLAVDMASTNKIADVVVFAFQKDFKIKNSNPNAKHTCIIDSAHLKIGPWETPADEEVFIRCLESDLIEEGFNIKTHEGKKKCKYYYGQTCPRFVYKIQFIFD